MPRSEFDSDVWPPDLWTAESDDGRSWWVAHTLPRQEMALTRDLLKLAIPYYLPCQTHRTLRSGVVSPVKTPLFSGYVFFRACDAERIRVLKTKRVANLLSVSDQNRLEADLVKVRKVLSLGLPVTQETELKPGVQVTVRSGPLMGATGTILRMMNGFKFAVGIDFIQRGISVLVDGHTLGI